MQCIRAKGRCEMDVKPKLSRSLPSISPYHDHSDILDLQVCLLVQNLYLVIILNYNKVSTQSKDSDKQLQVKWHKDGER